MKTLTPRFSLAASGAVLLLWAGLSSDASAQLPNVRQTKTITLGLVSEVNQKEISDHFSDFARYVARKSFSGTQADGAVVVTRTLPELAKLLEQDKVDYFMESPYPTYLINHVHAAAKLLLRRWKGGKAEYRSLIATNKDIGTARLQDLRGKIIAFEDPESTSGYFLPKFFLQRNGFKLSPVTTPSASVPPTQIGYVF